MSIPGTGGGHEPASVVGNPYTLKSAFAKLGESLNDVITTIEAEERSMGSASNEQSMLDKFKHWRMELDQLQNGQQSLRSYPTGAQAGGRRPPAERPTRQGPAERGDDPAQVVAPVATDQAGYAFLSGRRTSGACAMR